MACEQFLTFGNKVLTQAGGDSTGIQAFSLNGLAIMSGVYAELASCEFAAAIIPPNFIDTPTSGVVPDNTTFAISDLFFEGSPNGVTTYTILVGHADTSNTDHGHLTLIMNPDGITYQVEDNSTGMTWPFQYTGTDISIGFIQAVSNDPNARIHTQKTAVIAHNYLGFLGCAVPMCSTEPPVNIPLPSLGQSVKCANFSKIFNPLGIPLRSR